MADRDPNARVTAEQVMEIISTTLSEAQVNAFINTAHLVVQTRLANKGLDPALLTEIELWLAAHFVSMRDPRKKAVRANNISITYQGEFGVGLHATSYGQQAMALDPTGTLANAGLKRATIQAG